MSQEDFELPYNLSKMATVLSPKEAEQPILSPTIRQAIHQWMTEIRAEDELKEVGIAPRRTAMLSGPPGCGKTTLAHHLAARLGLYLVCIHMDRIRSSYVAGTGNNVADIFDGVRGLEDRCILFLDEFDAIASKRADAQQAADREHNAVVDALLARVEGYKGMMMAATNHADSIDPAIWRRFGMQLEIPLPGGEERFAILKRYLQPFELPDDALDLLTELTYGAAPSLLRQLMEGVKRDLILSDRLKYQQDIASVLGRIVAAVKPHKDYNAPPLWDDCGSALKKCESIQSQWPPVRKEAA